MYKRMFAFGDSFTYWHHPTWADIVRWHIDTESYENWGRPGSGNQSIFCRMIECDLKNKFTNDDLIIVMWSSWTREDRYLNDNWECGGNIFSNKFYDDNFIKKYWSFSNDIIKNSSVILAANKLFNIAFQGNVIPYEINEELLTNKEKEFLKFYSPHISNENVFKFDHKNIFGKKYHNVGHPDILQHINYFKNVVAKKLNIKPDNNVLIQCIKLQFDIMRYPNNNESNVENMSQIFLKKVNLEYDRNWRGF